MKYKTILSVLLFLLIACENPAENKCEKFTITGTSMEGLNRVYHKGGFLVRFSLPLDLQSTQPAEVVTGLQVYDPDTPVGVPPDIRVVPLPLHQVKGSGRITLNGAPSTFWYNPQTNSICFSRPDLAIDAGNQLVIPKQIASSQGHILCAQFVLDLQVQKGHDIKFGPSPFYAERLTGSNADTRVLFESLPTAFKIRVMNEQEKEVKVLEGASADNDFVYWDLEDKNGRTVSSGFYPFIVYEKDQPVFKSVLVLHL